MKKIFIAFLALAFAFALVVPAAAAGGPITAPNYPTQSIVQGDLTLHLDMPSLYEKVASIDKKSDALGNGIGFLVILGLLNFIGIAITLGLLIVRTKVLKALGLSAIAEDPKPGAAPPGSSGASGESGAAPTAAAKT